MHLPHTRVFNTLYRRAPMGWMRIFVAGVGGAATALAVAGKADVNCLREFWPLITFIGAVLGCFGGYILFVSERAQLAGATRPKWYRILRRTFYATIFVVAIGLFSTLIYGVWPLFKNVYLTDDVPSPAEQRSQHVGPHGQAR